jgi:hypothetical protein
VLDDASPELERIVRFLSEHSNLDIRLVTVSKYRAERVGTLFVPRLVISTAGEPPARPGPGPGQMRADLSEVVTAYDGLAPGDLRTRGRADRYRQVRPPEWPSGIRIHYEFVEKRGEIGVELHLESEKAALLAPFLAKLAGSPVGLLKTPLEWDPLWSSGRGRLVARYSLAENREAIAKAMLDLISMTRTRVAQAIPQLTTEGT